MYNSVLRNVKQVLVVLSLAACLLVVTVVSAQASNVYKTTSGVLYYQADSGEQNVITLSSYRSGSSSNGLAVYIKNDDSENGDSAPEISTVADPNADCNSSTATSVTCNDVTTVYIDLGDQNDSATISAEYSDVLTSTTILGSDGDDTINGSLASANLRLGGGSGSDELYGGSGNDQVVGNEDSDSVLYGGSGNDTIAGNAGNDVLTGGDGDDTLMGGDDSDEMYGNDGSDTVDYSTRTNGVTVTNDGSINSGEIGEGDMVDTSVENAVTGSGTDTVTMLSVDSENSVDAGGEGDDTVNIQDSGSVADNYCVKGVASIAKDDNDVSHIFCNLNRINTISFDTPADVLALWERENQGEELTVVDSNTTTQQTDTLVTTLSTASLKWSGAKLIKKGKKKLGVKAKLSALTGKVTAKGYIYGYIGRKKVRLAKISKTLAAGSSTTVKTYIKNKKVLKELRKKKKLKIKFYAKGTVAADAVASNAGKAVVATLTGKIKRS